MNALAISSMVLAGVPVLVRCLPLFLLACDASGPAEIEAVPVSAPPPVPAPADPVAEASPALKALAGTRWQGARPKMDPETGVERFDHGDPSVTFETSFQTDGTGIGLASWWGQSCKDDADTCAMHWKVVGDEIEFKAPEPDSLMGSYQAHIMDGELYLFTYGALLPERTGTVRLVHGTQTLRVEDGQCTLEKTGVEGAHTAPCAFEPADGHDVLTFEESGSDGTVSTRRLRWYPSSGLLAPPPAYVLREAAGG